MEAIVVFGFIFLVTIVYYICAYRLGVWIGKTPLPKEYVITDAMLIAERTQEEILVRLKWSWRRYRCKVAYHPGSEHLKMFTLLSKEGSKEVDPSEVASIRTV